MLIFFNLITIFIVGSLSLWVGINNKPLSSNRQGMPLGIFLSTIFSITIVILININIDGLESGTIMLFWLITFVLLFITGIRLPQQKEGISQNHVALPKFFGRRLENAPIFEEGVYWWIWFPFGEVDIYDTKLKTLRLSFGQRGKEISMPDGTIIKTFDISINYHIISNRIYALTNISNSIEEYLEEVAYDRIKDAVSFYCNSKTPQEIQENYNGLYALVLAEPNSSQHLKRLIERGVENKDLNQNIKGLIEIAKEYGIQIKKINITSYELPDNIKAFIDEKVKKILQAKAELKHATTAVEMVKVLTKGVLKLSEEEAMKYVLLMQKTPNFKYDIIQIDGSGNPLDKLSAALIKNINN